VSVWTPPPPARSARLAARPQNGGYAPSGSPGEGFASLLQLEAAPRFVRLFWSNDQDVPWTLDGASVAPSSGAYDAITPRDAAGEPDDSLWRRASFAGGGIATAPDLVPPGLAPPERAFSLVIPANTGPRGQPVRVCSDWIAVDGMPRRDGGAGALLLIRAFSRGHLRYCGASGPPDPALGRAHAGFWTKGDPTRPPWRMAAWARADQVFACHGVEIITATPGATVVGVGDSITHCVTSTGALSGFGIRACARLSTAGYPVSYVNEGFTGRTSRDYIAAGLWAVETLSPRIVLIQAWSQNDRPWTAATAEAAFSRAMLLADATLRRGGAPVLMTAAPVFAAHPEAEPARQVSLALTRAQARAGWPVLDLDALWGTGDTPNAYRREFDSGDRTHQTDAACARAGEALAELLRPLL